MAERRIPIDLLNPGHVFGCLGLMEIAEVLLGGAEGRFDWEAGESFTLSAAGGSDPVAAVVEFLAEAEVLSDFPDLHGPEEKFAKWKIAHVFHGDASLHSERETGAADRVWTRFRRGEDTFTVNHYADGSSRDAMKFWAGAAGKPGARSLKDLSEALADIKDEDMLADPFGAVSSRAGAPISGGMRLDWRRDYIAIDAGFSPNAHGRITMIGYPLVEICAVAGLGNARPERISRLRYRYGTLGGAMLPLMFHRAALGAPEPPFFGLPTRRFDMALGWPGQEGQARCITSVSELSTVPNEDLA